MESERSKRQDISYNISILSCLSISLKKKPKQTKKKTQTQPKTINYYRQTLRAGKQIISRPAGKQEGRWTVGQAGLGRQAGIGRLAGRQTGRQFINWRYH